MTTPKEIGYGIIGQELQATFKLIFHFKIIEKCVAEQLVDHIGSNSLNEIMQLAYKNITVLTQHYFKLRAIFCKMFRMAMSPAWSYLTYQLPLMWSITRSYCRGYNTGMESRE